jgi:hypothetical protein
VSALARKRPNERLGEAGPSIAVGDVIRTGDNFHPHYRVIALTEDRVWIRDTQHGTDHIVPLDRCNRI